MTLHVKQKSSTVSGKAPLPADIERGELAVNLADRQLYTKDQNDAVVKLQAPISGSQDVTIVADGAATGVTLGPIANARVGSWQVALNKSLVLQVVVTDPTTATATIVSAGQGFVAGEGTTIPADALGIGSAAVTVTIDSVATGPVGNAVPEDGAGLLGRVPSLPLSDPGAFRLLRPTMFAGPTPPQNPHVGMLWIDTSGAPLQLMWSGVRWLAPGDPSPAPGTFFADFTVEQAAADDVTITVSASGHVDLQSFIQWGDGVKTTGVNGARTHRYSAPGTYTIRVTVAGDAAVLDGGGGWPTITGAQHYPH